MRNFQKYQVWIKSHEQVLSIYKCTSLFPREEVFGITSQIRRSAVSIPSNIAEGCGRKSDPDFKRFLIIAFGSASELEYLLILSNDLKYIDNQVFSEHLKTVIQIKKMLSSLIKRLS